ncbi:MAG TPA: glycolate oxidase subunit GlcE [Accumulibacter sp.]|uniref:glycolate oxidase subunit GlcE n=1 Tax=Accumulibacter sp. TaxID=2053492 RepID=UPI00287A3548|nr:glycolate oxidase subunit GlcE [Accumulibacter sp.]MDS4053793.1 glycolate oxidase subunit GlcE [Accumulibacter sp.]HMV05155.1 glycolate oxidase subunit GlcE [Accumulibacter sp.]HMW62393.1 glycolate oxidase subunit GlcE [Accumulibacter sp.]HMW80622.1 glycolate oxidase subunit GlcE [Accumulibacter sp.]HMX69729.1 glycolate oxidase subunit GlcE [Accumulibacter sp.]
MNTLVEEWSEQVRAAARSGAHLAIRGGGSKRFYGGEERGEVLAVGGYQGIVAYEPTELVVTARAGTLLAELNQVLAERGQWLAFEPPACGPTATVGGMLASGLSGPRRQTSGAVRDFVLGVRILNGLAEVLSFGGQVMKNVAGYDVSRLMAGSLGTLGLVLEVSFKVLPLPVAEKSLRFSLGEAAALEKLNQWAGRPLPISASAWHDDVLTLRLSGAAAAVTAAGRTLGGEALDDSAALAFWQAVREQQHAFFAGEAPLWRLSLPSLAPCQKLGPTFIEWGGAQRWLRGGDPQEIRRAAEMAGGHATLFRADAALKAAVGVFQPLSAPLARIHRQLKLAFDPSGVFNPGRMYPDL